MSYEEDVAIHFGLQRRAFVGNGESLSVRAEGNAGQLVSSDITKFVCRHCPDLGKATSIVPRMARDDRTRRSLRTCCMRGNSKRENREILLVSAGQGGKFTAQQNDQKTIPTVRLI